MAVHCLNEDFEFDKITLTNPTGVQGGAYFSKVKYENEKLIIQTPKCFTKNGIKRGKKNYCDLMFNNENSLFSDWNELLEERIKQEIFKNRGDWFHDDLEEQDIEYNWNSTIRPYKSKFYLFRTFIEKSKILSDGPKLQIFNEDKEPLTIEDIKSDSNIICILEIKGLKFTSQSFHLECSLIQIMLLADEKTDKCLISYKTTKKKESLEEMEDIESDTKKSNVNMEMDVKDNVTVKSGSLLDVKTDVETDVKDNVTVKSGSLLDVEMDVKTDVKTDVETDVETDVKTDVETDVEMDVETNVKSETQEDLEEMKSTGVKVCKNGEGLVNEKGEVLDKVLEEIDIKKEDVRNQSNDLEILEVNLELPKDLENTMKLKKPSEVYLTMYRAAKSKAKLAKKLAIEAYLESKQIKKVYMLDSIESSDDEDLEKMIN